MSDESIKDAFQKVKQDIFTLGAELSSVKSELIELKSDLSLISSFLQDLKIQQLEQKNTENLLIENIKIELNNKITQKLIELEEKLAQTDRQTHQQTQIPTQNQTFQHINSTDLPTPTDNPTHPQEIGGLISPYKAISTGNRGVPTDTPTDRQTHQQTHLSRTNSLDRASELLKNLDALKKEVRLKFKRLTPQEMQVFSLLYTLEESSELVDYRALSSRLNLSESSIREYILKLEKKGIPIIKEKFNNKRIILHISPDLKQIASLNTIIQLRDL